MIRFLAKDAHDKLAYLGIWAEDAERFLRGDAAMVSSHLSHLQSVIQHVNKHAIALELVESKGRCDRFISTLQFAIGIEIPGTSGRIALKRMTPELVKEEVMGISDAFWKEMGQRHLAFIPTKSERFFEQEFLLGSDVSKRFPSAKDDMRDAGNCLALGLHSAAVSHLMGVVNIGLIALARHLKVKIKYIEHHDWHPILTAIRAKHDKAHRLSRGPRKQLEVEFYSEILGELSALKDVHRNNVSHSRKRYNEPEALGVFERVKTLMQRLATRLSE